MKLNHCIHCPIYSLQDLQVILIGLEAIFPSSFLPIERERERGEKSQCCCSVAPLGFILPGAGGQCITLMMDLLHVVSMSMSQEASVVMYHHSPLLLFCAVTFARKEVFQPGLFHFILHEIMHQFNMMVLFENAKI